MFGWFNPFGPPFRDDEKEAMRYEAMRRAAYAKEQARENTIRRLPCGDLVATIGGREYRSHAADCWYDAETGYHARESVSDKAQGLARRLKWAERDAVAPLLGPDLSDISALPGLAARTNKLGERE